MARSGLFFLSLSLLLLSPSSLLAAKKQPKKPPEPTPLDKYLKEALNRSAVAAPPSAGSMWSPASRFMNLGGDVRASQVDDLVTIVVNESASAVTQGVTKSQRQSALSSSITAAGGATKATGALANLVNLNTQSALNGQGTTTRSTSLNTTLSARVTHVLPNGYLVVEASKEVDVNSEHQLITVRGVVRPEDLAVNNTISSSQVAQVELKIDGKGVVNDSIRRPNIVWRTIMSILPF
jgi:flagellar L-ring protein precursor FlgH